MDWILEALAELCSAAGISRPRSSALKRARAHLAADQPEQALRILDDEGGSRTTARLLVRLQALVRLRDWDRAEALLQNAPFLDEEEAAVWADVRAQVRLGRGDLAGALAVLEAAEPVPKNARAPLELTRLRILAARGRDDEQVWTGLRKFSPEELRRLSRRHAVEPAARIAGRILDGGAYR